LEDFETKVGCKQKCKACRNYLCQKTEIHTSSKKLSALHKEDLKEDVHKSGNAVQTKAFYDRSGNHSAFEGEQLLAD